MKSYLVGDVVRLNVTFTDINGNLQDPTLVTLFVQAPDNSEATYTPSTTPQVIRDSQGKYHLDLPITEQGTDGVNAKYYYKWQGTGALVAVQEGTLDVTPTQLVAKPENPDWTYSGNPQSSPKDEVRFLIGDTDKTDPQLKDAEILYQLLAVSNPPPASGNFLAAAYCAEELAAKYSRFADKAVDDVKTFHSQRFTQFAALATKLRRRATLTSVRVYSGGQSIAEKQNQNMDTDRVQPGFKVDGMNYADPIDPNDPIPVP